MVVAADPVANEYSETEAIRPSRGGTARHAADRLIQPEPALLTGTPD